MTDDEILKLFRGMSESMQTAIIEIMKITQERADVCKEFRHRIISSAFEIEEQLKNDTD